MDPNDFGLLFKATQKLTDHQTYQIIQNRWKPTKDFDFPQTKEGQKTRKFAYGWLEKYTWLAYSQYFDGCFCIACSLFANRIGKNSGKLTKLLSEPLTLWTSAVTKFREHEERSNVHRFSIQAMMDFKDIMENRAMPVDKVGATGLQSKIRENRAKLKPIFKTIIFCGHENIPLRGHRDNAKQLSQGKEVGKFQALLDFRIDSGDKILEDHFKNAPKNATYRSKTVQNEIIECCGEYIRNTLVTEIKSVKFFSILADEAQDVSNKEQMALVLRYIDKSGDIKENFLKFIHCKEGVKGDQRAWPRPTRLPWTGL